jgi:hypothetical protein
MNYIRVRSSNIEAVGYEEDSQTLGVRFRDGGGNTTTRVCDRASMTGCSQRRLLAGTSIATSKRRAIPVGDV